jgi:hypothetical protein
MTGYNLPPGVSEWMIPGNRPEDAAYEAWAESVLEKAEEFKVGPLWMEDLIDGAEATWKLLEWVKDDGEKRGWDDARAEVERPES